MSLMSPLIVTAFMRDLFHNTYEENLKLWEHKGELSQHYARESGSDQFYNFI